MLFFCFYFSTILNLISPVVETEQDEGLEKLEESVTSTKHIALAVNEELDLHTRLIVRFFFHILVLIYLLSAAAF